MKAFADIFRKIRNERNREIMRRAGALMFALCLTMSVPVTALADTDPVQIDPNRTDCSITAKNFPMYACDISVPAVHLSFPSQNPTYFPIPFLYLYPLKTCSLSARFYNFHFPLLL